MRKTIFDYLFICHKIPERSFFLRGKQFPICSRCTGIFIGYIVGFCLIIISYFLHLDILKPLYSIILLLPMFADGSIQFFTTYKSNNIKRFITGILAGIGIMLIIFMVAKLGYQHGKKIGDHLF